MKQNKGIIQIIAAIVILAVGLAGVYSYSKRVEERLGATIPTVVAWFETTLSAKISSSATSMTLTSGEDVAGSDLDGYMCFTIDEGTASQEFVCGTASSTSVTSMIRGIDPIDGDLEVTALKKEHRRGASVKITDYPQIAIISRILSGDETLPGVIQYASDVTSSVVGLDAQNLASVAYVASTSYAGTVNAAYNLAGLVEIATTSEVIAGTDFGSTGAYLVVPTLFFNQTSSATNLVPVTKTTGKLDAGFIDQTANYTWTGAHTLASTTFSATTTFSSGVTFVATTSITGMHGRLYNIVAHTSSSTWTKPAGVTRVIIKVVGGGGGGQGGASTAQICGAGGGAGGYAEEFIDVSDISTTTIVVGVGGAAGTSANGNGGAGATSSFGAYVSAGGGSGGAGNGGGGGAGSGGDINLTGGSGGGGMSATGCVGGHGAGSAFGGGGGSTTASSGYGGYNGGGGGGGSGNNVGATGGKGIVIIYTYY